MPKLITPPAALLTRERLRLLHSELRWAYRGRTNPRYCGFWHHVPHLSAWLILKGEARVRARRETPGAECSARAGEWLVQPPGERWHQTSADCEILSLAFLWQWVFGRELFPLSRGLTFGGGENPGLNEAGLGLAETVARLFPQAQTDFPQAGGPLSAHLEVETAFHAWLALFGGAMMRHGAAPDLVTLDPRVETAVQLLDHPGREGISPAEIARQLGVSQGQMNRLFLRDLGTTVHDYREQRRVAAAHALLGSSGLSVKETAFRLGFRSPQHFSRWFKAHAGSAPSQVRQQRRAML